MKRKHLFFILSLITAFSIFRIHARGDELPYFPLQDVFGGSPVTDLTTFVPSTNDYTLETNGTPGKPIIIAFANISYTPETSGKVRFVQKNGEVYVFEDGLFKQRFTPDAKLTENGENILRNPSFEEVAEELSSGRWKPTIWDTWNGGMQTWGSESGKTNVREDNNYCSDGKKSIIMHYDSRQLYQQLEKNKLKAGTYYKLTYDYWTSSGSGNGGETYRVILRNDLNSNDYLNIQGHTTLTSGTEKSSFFTIFKVPEEISDSPLFILSRNNSKVDWLDNMKLVKVNVTNGITGVSSAIYLEGRAVAPGNLKLENGLYINMTEKMTNPGFNETPFNKGWTIEPGGSKASTVEKGNGLISGKQQHLQFWVGSGGIRGRLYQTISDLPNGKYTLEAKIVPSFNGEVYLYVNGGKTVVRSGQAQIYKATGIVFNGSIEVGVNIVQTTGSPAIDIDDFALHYLGIDEGGYAEVLEGKLKEARIDVEKMEKGGSDLPGFNNLNQYKEAIEYAENLSTQDAETLQAAIVRLDEAINEYKAILDIYAQLKDAYTKFENRLDACGYPKTGDFEKAIQNAKNLYSDTKDRRNEIKGVIDGLTEKVTTVIKYEELVKAVEDAEELLKSSAYPKKNDFENAINKIKDILSKPEGKNITQAVIELRDARKAYYDSQFTKPAVKQTVSWVDTSLDGSEKFVLRIDGKPFYMSNIQVRLDKLYGLEGWPDDKLEAVIKRAADDNFNTLSIPIHWREVEPEKDYFDWTILDKFMGWCKKYNLKMELLWFSWSSGGRVQALWNYKGKKVPRTPDYVCSLDGKSEFNVLKPTWECSLDWRDTKLRNREKYVLAQVMEHVAVWDANNGNPHTVIGLQLGNEACGKGANTATATEIINWYHHVGGAVKESKYVVWTRLNCIHGHTPGRISANEKKRNNGGTNIDFVGVDIYGTNASQVKGDVHGQLPNNGKNYKMIMEIDAKDSNSPIYQMAALAGDKALDYYNMGFVDGNGLYTKNASVDNGQTLVERSHISLVRQRNKILGLANQDIALKKQGGGLYVYNYDGKSTNTEVGIESISFTPDNSKTQAIAIRHSSTEIVLLSTQKGTFTLPSTLNAISASKGYFNADNKWVKEGDVEISNGETIAIPETSAVLVEVKDDLLDYGEVTGVIKNPSFENSTYSNGKYNVPTDWKLETSVTGADIQLKKGSAADGSKRYYIWSTAAGSFDLYQDITLPKGEYMLKSALSPKNPEKVFVTVKIGNGEVQKSVSFGSWNSWTRPYAAFTVTEEQARVRIGVSFTGSVMIDDFRLYKKAEQKTVTLSFPEKVVLDEPYKEKNQVVTGKDFAFSFSIKEAAGYKPLVISDRKAIVNVSESAGKYKATLSKINADMNVEIFLTKESNIIKNPSFEEGTESNGTNQDVPKNWKLEGTIQGYIAVKSGSAVDGTYRYYIWPTSGSSIDTYQEITLPEGKYLLSAALKSNAPATTFLYAKVRENEVSKAAATGTWNTWGRSFVLFTVPEGGATIRVGAEATSAIMMDDVRLYEMEPTRVLKTHAVTITLPYSGITLKEGTVAGANKVKEGENFIIEFSVNDEYKQHELVITSDGIRYNPESIDGGVYRVTIPSIQKDCDVVFAFSPTVCLNVTTKTLLKNETFQLTATVAPADAPNKNVTWSSSNESVATVSANGLVTAKAVGTATITATTEDGNKTASCVITVKKEDEPQPPVINVTGVSLNITEKTIIKGETIQLEATVAPADAPNKNVTWSSSDESVATVSASGLVTAKGEGTVTITVTTKDGDFKVTCEILVTSSPTSIEQINDRDLRVYTVENQLFVQSPQQEVIWIYTITGQLLVEKKKQAGQDKITLPASTSAIFIVKGSAGWVKKILK